MRPMTSTMTTMATTMTSQATRRKAAFGCIGGHALQLRGTRFYVAGRCVDEGSGGTQRRYRSVAELLPAHPNCRCWLTPIVDAEALNRETERILGL